MNNSENLSDELLKQDGIDPVRVSSIERAQFSTMLEEERRRIRRRAWIMRLPVWVLTVFLSTLCFSARLQEVLYISPGVAWGALLVVFFGVLVPLSLSLLYRCMSRKATLKRILASLPEYADKAAHIPAIAAGKRNVDAMLRWPDVITLGLAFSLATALVGGWIGCQLVGYWSPAIMLHCGLMGAAVAGFLVYVRVLTPLQKDSWSCAREPSIWKAILKSRVTRFVCGGVAAGVFLFSVYVAKYEPDPQDTVVLGQASLYSESSAALRVLVRNHATGRPIKSAIVQLVLRGEDVRKDLGRFATGENGCVSDAVFIPPVPPGKYDLVIESSSQVGKDRIVRQVEIKRPYRLYLTTDKPVYQPGQTLHMRAMVLNRVSLEPFSNQPVLFEIADPKGNKVCKAERTTSSYGIAAVDFDIANEVNLGRYRIRVIAGDVESEKVVTIKHYVLPKFKVEVYTNKSYYLPSEEVIGKVRAGYFFGKPVANARVEMVGRTIVEKPTDIFSITGLTDESGEFTFQTRLAEYFTGMPLAGGNAFLRIEITVTDAAGHEEKTSENLVIAQQPINIHVFAESGYAVPDVENIIYILTTYPDGRPAVCEIEVNSRLVTTDETGVAVLRTMPETDGLALDIRARDGGGNIGTLVQEIDPSGRYQDFLVRTDRAVYTGGQTINVRILSATPRATFFLDVIKDGQTMLTKTVPVEQGVGALALDLSADLFGTLKLNAYTITTEGESRADSRIVYVHQAGQLRIDTSLDKGTYRPGERAEINFKVTDSEGVPSPAALSLCVVDEAVFYVSENRPGLLEQFFLADEELLKPAYQIAFAISPAKLLGGEEKYQNLARALFSGSVQAPDRASILDDLAEKDFITPRMLERIRRNMEEGRYEQLLREPRYAHLAEILTGEDDYTLRATTYYDKIAQAEAFRDRYFGILKTVFIVSMVGGFALCLLGGLLYSTLRLIWAKGTEGLDAMHAALQRAANGFVYSYALLFLFPVTTYLLVPFFSIVLDIYIREPEGLFLGVFVTNAALAVILTVLQFKWSLALARFAETAELVGKMIVLPVLFIIQYIITRMIILACVFYGMEEGYAFLAGAISLLSTFIIYFIAGGIAGRATARHGVALKKPLCFLEVVTVIATCVFLCSLLTPSLSRVREFARTVSWASDLHGIDVALTMDKSEYERPGAVKTRTAKSAPRIRRYFPETLLWYPELITDDKGEAALELTTADSITTWRMNVDAVSAAGRLGNSEIGIRVFQDFFVDLDLPVALTRNDEVSIPVLCYNYLQQPQTVELNLRGGSWCDLQGASTQEVRLAPNEVKSAMFRIKAKEVGSHELILTARGSEVSDAVQRRIDVRPDGQEVEDLQSDVLTLSAEHRFYIPPEAIPNSQSLILKLYPSTFSEVVEGLESIFRMPSGCFEQTSSTTYPNVMALLYMKRTNQITPEIEVKARKFITAGYQRLLTFEVAGGGFDWFGHPPADEMLTAYGILEFTDMSKVHNVDPAVIDRASRWLMSKQNPDGSWNSSRFVARLQADRGKLVSTAYVTWALAEADQRGKEVDKALNFLRQHLNSTDQAYTIALAANAFLSRDGRDVLGRELVARLRSKFQVEDDSAYISSTGVGAMYSRGRCLDIETTALATLAMMKANRYPETIKKALTWISQQKDAYGTWHSTQATILAMKALIAGTGQALSSDIPSKIDVTVNGKDAGQITIAPDTSDLVHMLVLTNHLQVGENTVHIKQDERVEIPYRLVGTYWVPTKAPTTVPEKELEIEVDYDRMRLVVDDILTCNVWVRRNGDTPVGMAIIDLGIPPGFRVDTSAFEGLVESRTLAKYEVTGNQCILYVRGIEPGQLLQFSYELEALYPIRAMIPPSKVYEYYRPENEDQTIFREIVVEETSPERP